ncbi:ribonuclease E inhibitor RraB [Colwelliaceae bacterium 6471]
MDRDLTLYPEDEIGNAIWKLISAGVDLIPETEVEFSVIFPNQELALKFGQLLLENNQKLSFCAFQGDEDYPWEITAYPYMQLNYENVIAYQALLTDSAAPLKGKFDGWYCGYLNE